MQMKHRMFATRRSAIGWEQLEPRIVLDAQLVINEFVANSTRGLADEDREYGDWIEILNAGDTVVNLDGWHLTDDDAELDKWTMPARMLMPDETLVVFASGKNRVAADSPLHTNFRLDVGGEYLAIVEPDGENVAFAFAPRFPPQRVNVSYGITAGGEFRYFSVPTPNATNAATGYLDILEDVHVSHGRGFYQQPLDITVTIDAVGASIVYTTDGSVPSRDNGTVVPPVDDSSSPFAVIHLGETTTLKVSAVKDEFLSADVQTHTYVFLSDVVSQDVQATLDAGLPSMWGDVQADYGMDPDVVGPNDLFDGLYRNQLVDSLAAVPTLSIVMETEDMFGGTGLYANPMASGIAWERPTSVELIYPDGTPGFQIDAGIRIQGGASRAHANTRKKSLRLVFRDEYGADQLKFPLFGLDANDSFETITLRANYNDGWQHAEGGAQIQYVRDEWNRRTQLAMGQPSPHGTWAHVYINGIYWGLYNPVERPDASFMATYLGGDKNEWDVLNHAQVVDGTADAWNDMLRLAAEVDTPDTQLSDAAYQRLLGNSPDGTRNPELDILLDVENMIDYLIVNFYAGNVDWPANNWYAARLRGPESTGFKFFVWDAEKTLGRQSPLAANVTIANKGVAEAYGHLMANREFRRLFADRVQAQFSPGGALYVDPEHSMWDPAHAEQNVPAGRYDELASQIELALIAESARWGDQHTETPFTQADWQDTRADVLSSYFPRRTDVLREQLVRAGLFPQVSAPQFNHTSGSVPAGFELTASGPGVIFYTLDGSDPRAQDPAVTYASLTEEDAPVVALVPVDDSLGHDWVEPTFDDSQWQTGFSGLGYERGQGYEALIGIDTGSPMFEVNASAYMRVPFRVEDPSRIGTLQLLMKYDDGFVAYLNGVEVARANAPDELLWNSHATTNHRDLSAVKFETFELSDYANLLAAGDNVLAIHGLNHSAENDDFLIIAQLQAGVVSNVPYSGQALRYVSPIGIPASTVIKARSLLGEEWSALSEARLTVAGPPVRIAELMYHPRDPDAGSSFQDDDFEFIELVNMSETDTIDLGGVALTRGVQFVFPSVLLEPDQRIVVVRNRAAFEQRYGTDVRIAGEYGNTSDEFKLDNGGETLRLEDSFGQLIQEFTYDDSWYVATDGSGYSLTIVDSGSDVGRWNQASGWRVSSDLDGSPGRDDLSKLGDFNADGLIDTADIDLICAALVETELRFDLTHDDVVDQADVEFLVQDILGTSFGDANLDGRFDGSDLELAIGAGEYEDERPGNSTWAEGDWDCDGDFDSDDLILALATGRFRTI